MKKTLLLVLTVILFSTFYSTGHSQSFAIGYRVASGSFKPLDFVIDRYNQTRTAILTKNMDKVSSVSGLVYSVGYNFGEYGLEVEIPNLKSPTVTSETSTQIRELYMEISGFEFNASVGKEIFSDGAFFGFLGGTMSVDNVKPTIFTRIYNKNTSAGEFGKVEAKSAINMGIGPYVGVHLMFPSVIIFGEVRPFYKFSLVGSDFYDVNRGLNPATWTADNTDDLEGSMNTLGVTAKIGVTVAIF